MQVFLYFRYMNKPTLFFLLLFFLQCKATAQTFTWSEALKQDPRSVKSLDCSGCKWDSIPIELFQFQNLEVLNLSKNKIQDLPDQFASLVKLQELDLGRNKMTVFPLELANLTSLKILHLDRNQITKIPQQIASLQALETLDLYANAIEDFGEGLFALPNLKLLNLEGVMYGTVFAKSFMAKLPQTKVLMDPPCKCLD